MDQWQLTKLQPKGLPVETFFPATELNSKTLKMHATNVGPHLGTIKTDFC